MTATLAILAAITAASPIPADTIPEATVSYEDLDLGTAKGRRTMKQRIDSAARRVCGFDEHVTGTRIRSQATTDCYELAKARAMQMFAAVVAADRFGG